MAAKSEDKKVSKVVTAPLVAIKGPNGAYVYVYRGADVDGFDFSEVKRLEEMGLVGDASDNQDVAPGVAANPA